MPYGLPKKINTPAMNRKMELCVSDMMKTGKDKESSIKICKAQMVKTSEKHVGVFPFEFDEMNSECAMPNVPSIIHVIPIGEWEHSVYGNIQVTASDIRQFASNFTAGIRKGVFITAGHEGMSELPAVGWFTGMEVRDNGLWGMVEWNAEGKELLCDKAFKFFSPEFYKEYEDPETHQIYQNVLTGGALTKSPYFKELEAVVFSEPKIKSKFNENIMDITTIIAKDITTLTDEEKAFLKEHVAELTDEQKSSHASVIEEIKTETEEEKTAREAKEKADKDAADAKAIEDANIAAGLNADGTQKVEASEKILVSASELALLRKKADEGAKAFSELQKQKIDTAVGTLTFSESNKSGKFLPKSKDTLRAFMESLNEAQRLSFGALIAELPKANLIFSEIGKDSGVTEGTAQAEVENKVKAKMSENKDMKYSEALRIVMSENAGLEERYDKELPSARKVNA